jgi:hypothetical protein
MDEYLARTSLNEDISVLTKCRALHGKTNPESVHHPQVKFSNSKVLEGNKRKAPRQLRGRIMYLKEAPAEAEEKSCS